MICQNPSRLLSQRLFTVILFEQAPEMKKPDFLNRAFLKNFLI